MTIFFIFVIGAMAGSFMNVCIHRMPKKESIVMPPSHCPFCGKGINWFDNIPVLSYLILRGKCRSCTKHIPVRYLVIEIISGIIPVLLFLKFGISPKFFFLWYLTGALTVVSFIDLAIYEVPDEITISGIALGLGMAFFFPGLFERAGNLSSLLDSFLGVIAGGGLIYIIGFVGEFIFKKEAMGGGDVKLLAMIGAFLGWKLAILTFFLAPFLGFIPGIVIKIKKGESVMPYGPYLSLAALAAIFYGNVILEKIFYL